MHTHATTLTTVAEWASIVGVIGVAVAIVQLMRTAGAVKATRTAIERTEKHLALNQVLVLLPQLQKLEGDIDLAVETGAREAVVRYLVQWRQLAVEVHGLVEDQPYAEDGPLEQLRQTAGAAALAKIQLVGTQRNLKTTTESVCQDIAVACEYAARLSARLRTYSGEGTQ